MAGGQLSWIDLAVVLVYLALVVGKGGLLARKQKGVEDFFLAGRSMGWFAVGISVIASLFSGISYLGAPTEAFKHDLKYAVITITIPIVTPVVLIVFLPFFYNLKLYTAYEYLERRFSVAVRCIASAMFIAWRLGWMSLVLFAPSLALSEFIGIPWQVAIIVLGVCSTAYTFLGGIAAVIWTDVTQFFVLFGGILAVTYVCGTQTDGGLPSFFALAHQHGKHAMFDWALRDTPAETLRAIATVRVSAWGVLIGGLFMNLAAYATDQVPIQRYLTTKSLAESRRSLIFHAIVIVPIVIFFYYAGTMMWAFYRQQPGLMLGFNAAQPDRILPFFVVQQLPVGLKGVLVAALLAATMSSMDSGINSVTTATIMDFGQGLMRRTWDEKRALIVARIWTAAWGVIVTCTAILIGYWGKTLVEMTNKVAGPFMGCLLGIFLLGMLTRRANAPGVVIAAIVGQAGALYLMFATEVSFMWYSAFGCVVTFGLGLALSRLFPPPAPEQIEGLTMGTSRQAQGTPDGC